MDKPETKKMNYSTEITRHIDMKDAVVDGKTQKKADALEGTWIKLNEIQHALEEADQTTIIERRDDSAGCACERFTNPGAGLENLMCEHLIAFEDLKSPPQLTIESTQCRGLREVLISESWYAEDRRLYPPTNEPKLEPASEEKELDLGVDEEKADEPKTITRKCQYCGHIESGTDRDEVVISIEEHRKSCPKNPANKKKAKVPEKPKPTGTKSATVEKPPKTEKKKPTTAVAKPESRTEVIKKEMPTEAEFQHAAVGRILKNQGSIYKVGGKEVADSAAVSNYAVSAGVSTETTVLEQTTEYARATVRAYKAGRYAEGSVLIRKEAIMEKLVIDLAEKNPKWIIGWENGLPEFDLNQKVYIGDKQKILGLHIAGTLIDKWTFAARDCETKARRRAQIQMLGADWRETDEVNSEVEEMETVAKRR